MNSITLLVEVVFSLGVCAAFISFLDWTHYE